MADAVKDFLALQAGIEVTRGTEVNSTVILAGLDDLRFGPTYDVANPAELDGSMSMGRGAADVLAKSAMIAPRFFASFDELPLLLGMAYASGGDPAGDAGTPVMYSRTFSAGLTTLTDPATLTLEPVINTEEWTGTYGMMESYTLSAAKRGYTMFEPRITLKDLVQKAKTAALSRRAVKRILGTTWALTFDTSSAIGTTAITDCVEGFTLNSGPLYLPVTCQDGTIFRAGHQQQRVQPTLQFTVKAGSQSIGAFYNAYAAGSLVRMRLTNTSAEFIHTTVPWKVIIDITGNLLSYPEIGGAEAEGRLTRTFTLTGVEDVTTSRVIHITVNNDVALLSAGT